MEYGVGFYIFDRQKRLLLVKKHSNKDYAVGSKKNPLWLVPGSRLHKPIEDPENIGKEKLMPYLNKDVRVTKKQMEDPEYVGKWLYTDDKGVDYTFENYVVFLKGLSQTELENVKQLASKENKKILKNGREFFSLLNLPPEGLSILTGDYLRRLLFHKPLSIPVDVGKKDKVNFDKSLGNERNKYFLYDKAGGGSYGQVYKVIDIATLKTRAIKIANPSIKKRDDKWVERFILEGTTLMRTGELPDYLDKSIERVFSINKVEGKKDEEKYYLVKNWVEGTTLQKRFESEG